MYQCSGIRIGSGGAHTGTATRGTHDTTDCRTCTTCVDDRRRGAGGEWGALIGRSECGGGRPHHAHWGHLVGAVEKGGGLTERRIPFVCEHRIPVREIGRELVLCGPGVKV